MKNAQYIPLSFIRSEEEIKKLIRSTVVFKYVLDTFDDERKLGDVLKLSQYGYTASASESGNVRLLRITDIKEGKVEWYNTPFCDCPDINKYLLKSGDILVARTGGTTGKSFLIESPRYDTVFASYLIRIETSPELALPEFIYNFLNSYYYWSQIATLKQGSAQPNVNAEKLKTIIFPWCSTDIQRDILEIIGGKKLVGYEILEEAINTAIEKYKNLNLLKENLDGCKVSANDLRTRFLQDAIQGKLVPQDPNDEPAEVLYQKIQAEKANLIKEGKVKKSKPLPEIKPEEIPRQSDGQAFEIPKSWKWVRLGEIIDLCSGQHIQSSEYNNKMKGTPYITGPSDFIDDSSINIDKWTEKPKVIVKYGSLLITVKGSGVGKLSQVNIDEVCISRQLMAINLFKGDIQFIKFFLDSNFKRIKDFAVGIAIPGISRLDIQNIIFPLPPLSEQKRIVQKIESLFKLIDELEQKVTQTKEYVEKLNEAVLGEVFGNS